MLYPNNVTGFGGKILSCKNKFLSYLYLIAPFLSCMSCRLSISKLFKSFHALYDKL